MSRRLLRWIGCCVLFAAAFGWACSSSDAPDSPPAGPVRTVHIVEHGWHAGIALSRADLSVDDWAVVRDFPGMHILEVGWGDANYYQAADPGTGTLLKAGLWPTSSVMHVAAFQRSVTEVFPRREIIRLRVPPDDWDQLLAFIRESHARDSTEQRIPLGPGLYGTSQFYAATDRYHVFNNCNTWTTHALEAAGCSAGWLRTLTVRGVLRQARGCGTVIQQGAE